MFIYYSLGVRGGVVGGGTALQAGRSPVLFLMGSLGVFIDLILRQLCGPEVDSASNRNEHQRYLLGVEVADAYG